MSSITREGPIATHGEMHRAEMVVKRRELQDRGYTEVGVTAPARLDPLQFFVEQTRQGEPSEETFTLVRRAR